MTRPLAVAALLAVLLTSCASSLTVRATMPTLGGTASCADAPDTLRSPLWLHVRWIGPAGARPEPVRHDSVLSWPGSVARWQRETPAGVYEITVWASNRAGAGCSIEYADTAESRPGRVRVTP